MDHDNDSLEDDGRETSHDLRQGPRGDWWFSHAAVRTVVLVGVALIAGCAGGYVVGQSGSASFPCEARAVAILDISGLPEDPVEVHVPLRAGFSDELLPLEAALPLVTLGTALPHQSFRAAEGRLVLLVGVPPEAIGMRFEVVSPGEGKVLASDRLDLAPGCGSRST